MAESNRPRDNVPRFSSFKAKPNSQQQHSGGTRDNKDNSSRSQRGHGSGAPVESGSRTHRHKHPKDHRPLPSRSSQQSTDPFPESSEMSRFRDKDLFVTDLKGDVNNLKYGEIDQHSVPLYNRPNRDIMIGNHHPKLPPHSYAGLPVDEVVEARPDRRNDSGDESRPGHAFEDGEEFVELEAAKAKSMPEL